MKQAADDRDLIEQIIKGNTIAFKTLLDTYQEYAFNLAMKFTAGNKELSEEVTQDVFMKVIKYLPSYKKEAKFSTWLYKIIFTTSMSEVRKKNILVSNWDFNEAFENYESSSDWDVYAKEKSELQIVIAKAMRQIPTADSSILDLYYIQEQGIEEITYILGVEKSVVKVRLFRARNRLRAVMLVKETEKNK
ncbi:RNA polymerase sigma factor [Pedobacter endophyticus]|uniref:RNA polymerase sigma factor n=1 Tax=Pedobacter endophyticus TaxID=2789740 RepID=A0A7S9Q046_9SPHI|nr:RNA polymerase sigma factor [Pedobacter endophyticus]QPH40580.1 RNA polymerase sigma factor [Pedobacter endophyticus]